MAHDDQRRGGSDAGRGGDPGSGDAAVTASPGAAAAGGTGTATGVAVDPRMRSRRIEVRRDAGRRRLRRVTLVLGLLALVIGALAATRTSLLDVDRIEVEGARRTDVGDVVRATGVERGDPMVTIDAGAVARRVEALPWVDEARVVRSWPATLAVQVSERAVQGVVQLADQRAALVDAGGRVLAIEPWAGDAVPSAGEPLVVTGVEGQVAEGERLTGDAREALVVAGAVAERMPGAVASVSTDLDAVLVDGGAIRFGSAEQLDDKITAAKTVLADVDTACLEVLDVRVPGSPALTRNQRCS